MSDIHGPLERSIVDCFFIEAFRYASMKNRRIRALLRKINCFIIISWEVKKKYGQYKLDAKTKILDLIKYFKRETG